MEELGLPYELVFKPGDLAGSMALAKAAHPMGIVPAVRIGEQVFVESGAILEIITTRFGDGRLWPAKQSSDYGWHIQWMHYAEGTASARILDSAILHSAHADAFTTPIGKVLYQIHLMGAARVMDMVEAHLSRYPFFGGAEFTTADIMMWFPIWLGRLWGIDYSTYPHITPWVDKMTTRPGYKKMLSKALPNGPASLGVFEQPVLSDIGKVKKST
jgi:glutathione S-transferase